MVETSLDIAVTCSIEIIIKDIGAKESVTAILSYYTSFFLLASLVYFIIYVIKLLYKHAQDLKHITHNQFDHKENENFHLEVDDIWEG